MSSELERRVRIGGQTAFSAPTMTVPFDYAVEHGFDAFEWFPDKRPTGEGWLENDVQADTRARIQERAREHDIALSVHGSWHASLLSAAGRECLGSQARLAADIGAVTFVVHLDEGVDSVQYLDAAMLLAEQLAAWGIRLVVENTPATAPDAFNELFRLMRSREEVSRGGGHGVSRTGAANRGTRSAPSVGMCLDVGHANLYAGTRNDYLAYIDLLSADVAIAHVHLHENWGDADSHLPLFTGPAGRDASGVAGLVERLVRRRFAGCIILEQWPEPPALLDLARSRLGHLFAAR